MADTLADGHRKTTGQVANRGQASGKRVNRTAAPVARAGQDPAEALANSKAAGLVTRVLPYVSVVIAAFAPLAAGLYLLTTVAWTIGERRLFMRNAADAGGAGGAGGAAGAGGPAGTAGAAMTGTR